MQCEGETRAGARCRGHAKHGERYCAAHLGIAGRRSKLTEEVSERLVKALSVGNYRETAARFAGVGVSTLYRWLEQGEADADHDVASEFRELWEAVTRAEAEAEVYAVGVIRRDMTDDWRAAAHYLERKFGARWGRRWRLSTERPGNSRTSAVLEDLDAEIERLIAEIAEE